MKSWLNRAFALLVLVGVVAILWWAFTPQPIGVDTAAVTRGPLRITVDEDGQTRIKEKYVVSSPLNGRVLRIDLDPGDVVERDKTVVAIIEPSDPELLDPRALAQAKARVQAAEAAVARSRPAAESAEAEMKLAERTYLRIQRMFKDGAANQQELDDAELLFHIKTESYKAATFAETIAQYELELARAALIMTTPADEGDAADSGQFVIRSPTTGQVLRVFQESAAVVTSGSALLEVGDPRDIEIVVDVLSNDAVRIEPGASVIFEHWGGDQPLTGIVRLIEPAGFTKISALGVEEQRVNVIIDLTDPPDRRPNLGDAYRVEARIAIWHADDVLKVPTSALFREGEEWAVFRIEGGIAKATTIQLGGRTGLEAQVISGLSGGDQVIIHPSDQVTDGVKVQPRSATQGSTME